MWMDVDQMKGNLLDAMAEAVLGSEVVLLCVSEQYGKSLNCRSGIRYLSFPPPHTCPGNNGLTYERETLLIIFCHKNMINNCNYATISILYFLLKSMYIIMSSY